MKFNTHRFLTVAAVSAFVAMAGSGLFAQSTIDGQIFNNLKTVEWKATADLASTIGTENARMDDALSQPNLAESDRSLFLAYKKLLGYIQADVNGNVAVADALIKDYDKVVVEAPNDKLLQSMIPGTLAGYLSNLVEILQPTPDVVKAQKF